MSAVAQVAAKKNVPVKDLLCVECHDSLGEAVPVHVTEISTGKFSIKYTPKKVGTITVYMAINGQNLRQSGTRVSGCACFLHNHS